MAEPRGSIVADGGPPEVRPTSLGAARQADEEVSTASFSVYLGRVVMSLQIIELTTRDDVFESIATDGSSAAGELLREPTNNTPVRVAPVPSGSGHTLTRCQQRASPLAAMGSPPRRRCTMLLRDKMQSPWFGKRKSFARASWSVRTGCSSCCSPSAEQLGDQFGDRSSFPWATGEWRATLEEGRPSAA